MVCSILGDDFHPLLQISWRIAYKGWVKEGENDHQATLSKVIAISCSNGWAGKKRRGHPKRQRRIKLAASWP